ncbi:MAG: hypothetical protein CVT68_02885 [Actinobacteria bacterium HGW-Actinobacteria-8]|nr:MAG: hypothetical protein CVT68_02885 [Actinobacteria bacterium HGW-Actinobacteria-8]
MSDLVVEGDALHDVARTVRTVIADFRSAGAQAHDAAQHVGHHGLAQRVTAFADQWDIHRERTMHLLERLADALDAVNDTFADLDREAAAMLPCTSSGPGAATETAAVIA